MVLHGGRRGGRWVEKVEALMCGRYTDLLTWAQIVDLYEITSGEIAPNDFRTSHNVAPTQRAPIVRRGEKGREAALLR